VNRPAREARGPRTPQRTCVGCRRVAGPDALVRLSRRPDGGLAVGRGEPGRGAWLCAGSVACFEAAVRRKALSRALRAEVLSDQLAVVRERLFVEKVEKKEVDGS
jgi:predicted RNA-binding protein YlxR (DUF448 family)